MLFRSAWGLNPGLRVAIPGDVVCIDLRSYDEKTPAELTQQSDRVENIPVQQGGVTQILALNPGRVEYSAVYRGILANCRPAVLAAVEAVAKSLRPGVVMGCSIGKDRTGVLLALILSAIGVPTEDIVRAERGARGDIIRHVEALPESTARVGPLSREQVLDRLAVAAESIGDCLAHCEITNGSAAAYLADIGVSEITLDRLTELLV